MARDMAEGEAVRMERFPRMSNGAPNRTGD
jgi:hypothetical protein